MGKKSGRKNDSGNKESKSSGESDKSKSKDTGGSVERIKPGKGVTVNEYVPRERATRTQKKENAGDPADPNNSYVSYDAGPNRARQSDRYGITVSAKKNSKLQRLEKEFGSDRVQRWADEGMPVKTMGKPRDMKAFRERQVQRPEEVPTDIERRNADSAQRNAAKNQDRGPAGETGVPDVVRSVVSSPGTSMDETVQREMESKMGDDFSDVQVHTGPQAAAAADSINARAFTVGNHVAFDEGEYQPKSDEGKRVLAHELTHVRQGTAGRVSMLPKADADPPGAEAGSSVSVQPKLKVSSPDDPAEKEAEQVAEKVMEMNEQDGKRPATGEEGQAAQASAERAQRDAFVRTVPVARAAGGGSGGGGESAVRKGVQGEGKPLPSGTRSEMESKMGADFSNVSVHTGQKADAGAKSISAKAYTMGSDIAFSKGNYNPSSQSGKKLLAHELTHTVQQTKNEAARFRINRTPTSTVSRSGDSDWNFEGETVTKEDIPDQKQVSSKANFKDATIEKYTIQAKTFNAPVNLTGATINGTFTECVFGNDVIANKAYFRGSPSFINAKLHQGITGRSVQIDSSANFTNAQLSEVRFANLTMNGQGNFQSAAINGVCIMQNSAIGGSGHLKEATVKGTGGFTNTEVYGDGHFQNAQFNQDMQIEGAVGKHKFKNATVNGKLLPPPSQGKSNISNTQLQKIKQTLEKRKKQGSLSRNVDEIMADLKTVRDMKNPIKAVWYFSGKGYISEEKARQFTLAMEMKRRMDRIPSMEQIIRRSNQRVAVASPSGGMTTVKRKHLAEYKVYRELKAAHDAGLAKNPGAALGYIVSSSFSNDHEWNKMWMKLGGAAWSFGSAFGGNNYVKGVKMGKPSEWMKPQRSN